MWARGVREETIVLPSNPKLFTYQCGPDPRQNPESILVVLVHGFPELGYSWRYQWGPLSRLGYSVCSPDMRGYGRSWIPSELKDYSLKEVTKDLVDLLKVMKRKKAVFVGHDIGGSVIWAMGLHHPEVCLGLVAVNTPLYVPPATPEVVAAGGPLGLMKTMDPKLCGQFDYQVYFQNAGEEELNKNVERTVYAYFRAQISESREKDIANMRIGMRTGRCRERKSATDPSLRGVLSACPEDLSRDPLWSEEEMQVYIDNFKRTGFPLKWYRQFDENWKWHIKEGVAQIPVPCLMITAEYDAVLSPELSKGMEARIPDLERKHIVCGHWSMIERKQQVNDILVDYLTRRFPLPQQPSKL